MNLKVKVTLAFLLFIVGPFLIVGWVSAYKASESMKDEVGRTMLQLVKQNHLTIEKSIASVNDKTVTFLDTHFFDPAGLNFWLGIDTLGEIRRADTILESWSSDGTVYSLYMNNTMGSTPPIDLSNKQRGFAYLSDGEAAPDGAAYALREGGAGVIRRIESGTSHNITFMRSILNPQSYDEIIGVLMVSNLEVFLTRDLVSVQLPDRAGIYLLNELGELLMQAGTEKEFVGTHPPASLANETEGYYFTSGQEGEWLVAFSYRPSYRTNVVYQIPLESITGSRDAFQWLLLGVSAIYLVLVLLFVLYLLRLIIKPLVQLVSMTKIYEPGRSLDHSIDRPRSDEFGILYGAFLKMMRRLDQSVEENYVMKIKHKENELATLHSQITPHLLYNTLDSIYWYALDSGNQDVGDMVKYLSKLLRIGLSRGRTMITIGEEIEHVKAYSRLQMKRYPDQFTVHWEIDEAVQPYITPKVILQPFVENAIFHGVSSMDGEGAIWVRAAQVEEHIEFRVEDNGFIPVDMERLEQIVRGEHTDKGYGIRNVHQRIQLHFGESYGLRYVPREGGGVCAIIHIPSVTDSSG